MKPNRLANLDGWRGISILLVLACHLLPIGPKVLHLNEAAGAMGMSLFFTLSGFLITSFLLGPHGVGDFIIRRACRIVPLAWLGMAVSLALAGSHAYLPHYAFIANLVPGALTDPGSHLWSVCVEVQFYAAVALLVAVGGRRALYLLPVLCIAVTVHRVLDHRYVDIGTLYRVDEILAGGVLALLHERTNGAALRRLPTLVLLAALFACSLPQTQWMNYLRPYAAAALVGSTLYRPSKLLSSRALAYIAEISFALYIFHHVLMFTWLGDGSSKAVKYAKRPLLFAATFVLAHLSTYYFERRFIELGRRLTATRPLPAPAVE